MTSSTLPPNLLQQMFQFIDEACLVAAAPELTIVDVNRKACRVLGRTREEMLGMPLLGVECALQDIFFWDELNANLAMEGQRVIESEWMTSAGTTIPIEKRVTGFTDPATAKHYWIVFGEDITSRQRIAQEQLLLTSQLQSSLEATAEGILSVALSGKVVNLNQRFITMWHLSDDLVVERNESAVMNHVATCLIDPKAFKDVLALIKSDAEVETETTLSLKDGRHVVCVSKPEYLRDRLVGRVFSVRDITAMKKVEQDLLNTLAIAEQAVQEKSQMLEALKVGEARLRRLINANLIGICQGDTDGQLILANDTLMGLLGVTQDDIARGKVPWATVVAPESVADHEAAFESLKTSGHAPPYHVEMVRKDGQRVPAMIGLAQLEGAQFEWVAFVLDLTEQKKADRVKSEFISVVSHELRTPITSIRGAMSILEGGAVGELSPKALNLVQIAHRNSQRLAFLVNDILDMEKLISGKMQFKSEPFDLCVTAQQAVEANSSYASALDVRYELTLLVQQGRVVGDPERTMQVFANLLSNAAKFSPKGESVDVRVVDADKFLRIEVQDRGPGIPVAFREHIFSKFAQADSTNKRQQGGTGLGLSIAKTIVEKMGGEIGFESEVGKGSLFWFTLPK